MNNYFPHDSNARNSDKIIPLRMKHGAEGYGIYFMLLERLREETDYMSVKDYNMLAFDLRVDTSMLKSVVEEFGLFAFTADGKCFYSESFTRRMEIKDEVAKAKSEAGKKGAAKRWGNKKDSTANSKNSTPIAEPSKNDSKESKGKETKQNKTKLNETKEYSVWLSPNAPVPPGQNDELEDIMVPFQKILDYLNDKTGKHFQNIAGNQRHIQSRWNEGNRFEDFKTVIDNMVEQWGGKYFNGEPMDQYLRPSTLFGDKFDQYLNMTPPEKEETYARDESDYDLF